MTTSFARLHKTRFPALLQAKGRSYFKQGRVELIDLTETRAVAKVRGSQLYRVELQRYRETSGMVLACDCPYSMGSLACKHLWAVLLAIDEVEAGITAVEQRERGSVAAAAVAAFDDDDDDDDDDDEDFDDDDDAEEVDGAAAAPPANRRAVARPTLRLLPRAGALSPEPEWQSRLREVRAVPDREVAATPVPVVEYVLGKRDLEQPDVVRIHVVARLPKKDGMLGVPRYKISGPDIERLPVADRQLLTLLDRESSRREFRGHYGHRDHYGRAELSLREPWRLPTHLLPALLPLLARVGRVLRMPAPGETAPMQVRVDAEPPFRFELAVAPAPPDESLVMGVFRRGDAAFTCQQIGPVQEHDIVLSKTALHGIDCGGGQQLAAELARGGPIRLATADLPRLMAELARLPGAAQFLRPLMDHLPVHAPQAVLLITVPKHPAAPLPARVQFDYGGQLVDGGDEQPVLDTDHGLRRRDVEAERTLRALLAQHELQPTGDGGYTLVRERLLVATAALTAAGVRVLVEGQRLRAFQVGSSGVTTGIDWFELGGTVAFTDHTARMPELLNRPITPEGFVELGDGSLGLLPQTWLRRLEAMRALGGEVEGDVIRVPSSRALLLDALLSAKEHSDVVVDAAFAHMRQRLAAFTKVESMREPAGFAGELRPYQRDGLGWLQFLREFGFGGCLADDMGLGKTVQVLAHLCRPREAAVVAGQAKTGKGKSKRAVAAPRPTLLVAPRSVLGNWLAEAARFAPGLRVLDFSTPDRWRDGALARLRAHDLVLTTYAMLRVDAPQFVERELAFHYAILDEAQAVKNPDSLSSKAVRLLTAQHRLVLTGTPVENHLGDLWSLFEFLNPGMLGRLPAFRALFGKEASGEAMAQHRELVQRALRPVMLRRTKQQVLKDLPDKVEQTLWCELGPVQRKRYEALRKHYQQKLLAGPGELDDSQRFMVLEALLRLRQAACHEALLPGGDRKAESAKFDELLPRLEELAAEGHKALVFSQFTSVLDLLEPKLRERGIDFERLDGQTTKRPEHVARFQNEAKCAVFLISLKAGGFGLNLTAASYVFVLDPWWNPAAEMQAIDRAHRIGQKRVVNAYRLVCKGTVEERVLELQAQKKALCELILGNERSLLQDLKRADLELLLG